MIKQYKRWLCLVVGLVATTGAQAQNWVEVSAGSSMAEWVVTETQLGVAVGDRWQVLGSFRYGQNRFTFIEARPITDGDAMQAKLGVSVRLAEQEHVRLDAFLLGGYRRVEDDAEPIEATAHFITVEPGLVASVKVSDYWTVQTGVNLWWVQQRQPSILGEQTQNTVLQLGSTYALTDRLMATLHLPVGPSYGGGGDTQKFYWEARVGLRWRMGSPTRTGTLLFP